ncbi:MAG: YbaN family protein [Polyangiaceae bacterium]
MESLHPGAGPAPVPPALAALPTATSLRRALWLVAGLVSFAVGAVGVLLPGIPTTGPMLLALACFARSSPRLHDWLLEHPRLGPPLKRWRRDRIIPLRAKVMALSMMALSLTYVALWSPLPRWAVLAIAGFIALGAVVVLRIPHRPRG